MEVRSRTRLTPAPARTVEFTFKPEKSGQSFAAVSDAEQLARAHAFGFRIVAAWWRALVSPDRRPQPLREFFAPVCLHALPDTDADKADAIGDAAAGLDPEAALSRIGKAYSSLLPPDYRAKFGIYYTPPALAKTLIDQATLSGVNWTSARVLDPACGGGAFLAPVANRIIAELSGCSPRILLENIASRLRGYEIDPFGAWLSQVALDAAILPVTREARKRLPVVVSMQDSLRSATPAAQFDLVIGNPPYGRTSLDATTRAQYLRSLYGHANLYGLFTDLALRHAKQGGIVAFVTPTSFLAGEYFKKLRALLASEAPPASIAFVAARKGVFENVLQETLLATYQRAAPSADVRVYQLDASGTNIVNIEDAGTIRLPTDPSKPWLLPRSARQSSLVRRLGAMQHRLSDWGYSVSTGPLVWNRHKDQLAHRPGAKRFPLIWAEAVTPDGGFVWRAEKKNHALYFEVRPGDDWLISADECVLVQRTTAKEQNRRLIACSLPRRFVSRHGAVVIENHLNMVRAIGKRPPVSAGVLAAFLNSAAADQAFRCVSGSVAVSAFELEALPLPAPDALVALERLVRAAASQDRIDGACMRLYEKEA